MATLSSAQARRIALAAQGFAETRPTGRIDVRHLRRVMRNVGILQMDSVNVVTRAHYLPVFSRLGPYPREALDDFAYGRKELFEYWGHMVSLLPVDDWPLFGARKGRVTAGRRTQWLLDEIRRRGPLSVSDLEDPGERRGDWWGHGKGKIALEWHFAVGNLTVANRVNFNRIYDLPERVYPEEILAASPLSEDEAYREKTRRAARHLGIATAADLADYYRVVTRDIRPHIDALVAGGELEQVEVEGWDKPAYLDPAATVPRRIAARSLLSPFDSLIWDRARTERIFGFHYRIEIYVPKPKRIHGYYVFPFLLGENLVARVDLKADRHEGALLVQGAYLEPGRDERRVARELAAELGDMAAWLGMDAIRVGRRGDLAAALRGSLS